MKYGLGLAGIVAGTALAASAIVITLPSAAMALTGEEVNDISREVTVLIVRDSTKQQGSGVIISKNDKTYYVLTAYHVVGEEDQYKLVTNDKKAYQLDYSKFKRIPGVDLAVVEFSSNENYRVAKLANSDLVKEGKPVFVSGWPKPTEVTGVRTEQRIRQFTDGRVSGILEQPYNGYKIAYTNTAREGMSGGPVIDAGGRVIGIHGVGDSETQKTLERTGLNPETAAKLAGLIKPGFNYGIPINTFLGLAPQAGLYLNLQVENSPASELGAPYIPRDQPDKRDTIDNIADTLSKVNNVVNTVNEGVNTIQRVCGFFGC